MRCRPRMARGSTNLTTVSAPRRSAPAACSRVCCISTPPRRSSVRLLSRSRGHSTALSTLPASAARGRRWSLRRRCCAPASSRMRRRSRCRLWRRRRRSRLRSTIIAAEGAAARAAAVDVAVRRERAAGIDLEAAPSSASASSASPGLACPRADDPPPGRGRVVAPPHRRYGQPRVLRRRPARRPLVRCEAKHEEESARRADPLNSSGARRCAGTPGRRRCCRGAASVCSADDAAATRASVVVSRRHSARCAAARRGRARLPPRCVMRRGQRCSGRPSSLGATKWSTAARSRVAAPHVPAWASSSGRCSTRRPSASASALRTRRQRRSSVAFTPSCYAPAARGVSSRPHPAAVC